MDENDFKLYVDRSLFENVSEKDMQDFERWRKVLDLKKNDGERFSIKQLEKSKKQIEEKLKKMNDSSKKDTVVTFEQLGVDRLFVDEAHNFKNLYLYTKMRNVRWYCTNRGTEKF